MPFCIDCVTTGNMGVIERLGKFSRIAGPGPNLVCWPFDAMAGQLSTRVKQLIVDTNTKTRDNVRAKLCFALFAPTNATGSQPLRAELCMLGFGLGLCLSVSVPHR